MVVFQCFLAKPQNTSCELTSKVFKKTPHSSSNPDDFVKISFLLKTEPMRKTTNQLLHYAKKVKKDEFYTQLVDIEKELKHYKKHFKNKVVYCNCDDPRTSNFFYYFAHNFEKLGLKKLMTTCYQNQNPDLFSQNNAEKAIYLEYKRKKNNKLIPYPEWMKSIDHAPLYTGDANNPNVPSPEDIGVSYLKGDGDFRSGECIEILKKADIIVTNPPFSLFRAYVAQLIAYDKQFIIIGNINAVTYREIFPLMKHNQMWLSASIHSGDREFGVPNEYPLDAAGTRVDENGNKYIRVKGVRWFTNLDHAQRHEDLILCKQYNKTDYPKYDNHNAINVDKTKDIPSDYAGCMGVPITFLDKYNPRQFEIVKFRKGEDDKDLSVDGRCPYFRILIKKKP